MARPVLKIWFASIRDHSGSVINAFGMLVEFAFPDSSIVKEKLKEATSHCRLTSEHFALYSLGQLPVQSHLQYHCCHCSTCQNFHESWSIMLPSSSPLFSFITIRIYLLSSSILLSFNYLSGCICSCLALSVISTCHPPANQPTVYNH